MQTSQTPLLSNARRGTVRLLMHCGAIFALALLMRVVALAQLESWPLFDQLDFIVDSRFYDFRARTIASGQLGWELPSFLSPLYGYALGLAYAIGEPGLDAARAMQTVLGSASCVLLYLIGRKLFGEAVGILAGVLLSLYGLLLFYNSLMLPATIVLFLNLAALYAITGGGEKPGVVRCLVAGLLVGLAAAAKPNALLLLPAFGAVIAFSRTGWAVRDRSLRVLALAAGTILAVAPFAVRNYSACGEWVLVSTTGGRNLYKGNGPGATGSHAFFGRGEQGIRLPRYLHGRVEPHEPLDESRRLAAATWDHVRANPSETLSLLWRKFRLAFNTRELGVRDNVRFVERYSTLLQLPLPAFGFVAPIGLVGLLTAFSLRKSGFVHAMFSVQIITFVGLFVLARYRVVGVACLILFASHQLVLWWNQIQSGSRLAVVPTVLALVPAVLFVHYPIEGFTRERGFALQHYGLGMHFAARGEHEEAVSAFRKALGSDWMGLPSEAARRLECRFEAAVGLAHTGPRFEARSMLRELEEDLVDSPSPENERLLARVQDELARLGP